MPSAMAVPESASSAAARRGRERNRSAEAASAIAISAVTASANRLLAAYQVIHAPAESRAGRCVSRRRCRGRCGPGGSLQPASGAARPGALSPAPAAAAPSPHLKAAAHRTDASLARLPDPGYHMASMTLLSLPLVERLLGTAMSRGAEFAEVYVERATSTAVSLDEGKIKSAQVGSVTGVGVRAIRGAQVGYAYSDDLDEPALLRTAQTAALIADGTREPGPVNMARKPLPTYYQVRTPLADVDVARKIAPGKGADAAARAYDKRVKQVTGGYADQTREILVANTLGHLAEDRQDLCRLGVQCVAFGKKGERRTGFYGGGGRVDFRFFEDFSPGQIGREAARQAVATLAAVNAPSGPQTVVLAPGWSGILLHEAVGHGLEADFIRKGTSLFAGKLGEKVASELVTVIDDGTVSGGRGSINVDDEGNPGERKVLIENGVLKGYLYDHLNAKLTGQRSTGSGRRQSFRYAPMPRMTT